MMREESFLPFDVPRPPAATHVRSTLLCSAVQAIRARHLWDAYLAALPRPLHPTILSITPGHWLPIDVALAHYAACDALAIESRDIESIGAEIAERIHHSFVGVAVKVTREAGATPWTLFSQVKRLRDLTWRGGDCALFKLGPKEARFEWIGMPCARSRYYRTSFMGFMRAHCELFCKKAYAVPIAALCKDTSLAYRLSWV